MIDRFQIIIRRLGRWFEEEEVVAATGQVQEQMENLYISYKKLCGKNDISIKLVDQEKGVILEEHTF